MKNEFALSRSATAGSLAAAVLLLVPLRAQAIDLAIKLEPVFAGALAAPQMLRFTTGGGLSARAMIGLGRCTDITAGAGFVGLPAAGESASWESAAAGSASSDPGSAWTYGIGLRFKRFRDERRIGRLPWIDAEALVVRTGPLDRFGFAVGAGVGLPLGDARRFWIGPFARYVQILQQPSRVDFNNRDLKMILVGVSLEAGPSPMRAQPLVIFQPDAIELTEKIQFTFDNAVIDPSSYPALDAVVEALEDDRNMRVEIEGHASGEGVEAHNQGLSEQRAQAVLDYLVGRGIAPRRLRTKGFSSSHPAQTNSTTTGREANRRVEFAVRFVIVRTGSTQ